MFLGGDQKLNLSLEAERVRGQDCSLKEKEDGCTGIDWPDIIRAVVS